MEPAGLGGEKGLGHWFIGCSGCAGPRGPWQPQQLPADAPWAAAGPVSAATLGALGPGGDQARGHPEPAAWPGVQEEAPILPLLPPEVQGHLLPH